mmetsp:Transcript_20104/g.28896  ORF Transcript_20104/g.28896 Transcript_20104/m.28896 type:complete len:960 (+) Transcript_20104:61-2940(+)|eukprot:CAMPEP_0185024332 /NCGR_PEP_ID=MMETSP1103-20130426/7358_1 /TAXON_ID=36769 /ORGANISM="Paraphysomonas bandaiensis, Strain Caron Lab Isolate" /LENGTH=959 /DNA_ID=CAMNT_0027557267 /DNA_START=61 /DNA_END=2940 /DNA_ORIENTATION=-
MIRLLSYAVAIATLQCTIADQGYYEVVDDDYPGSIASPYNRLSRVDREDDHVKEVELPFPFPFFGKEFNYAYISTNGLINFGSGAVDSDTISQHNAKAKLNSAMKGKEREVHVESELASDLHIVVLQRHLSTADVESLVSQTRTHHGSSSRPLFSAEVVHTHPNLRMFTVRSPSKEAAKFLSDHEHVLAVHEDREVSAVGNLRTSSIQKESVGDAVLMRSRELKSNPYSWGLDRIDQADLPLDEETYVPSDSSRGGEGVSVYVVDTGLDTTHNEFANTDDREVLNKFNYFGGLSANTDQQGHGTHCAGTAAGINVGVAPNADLYGVKVLDDDGRGSTTSVVAGLEYVLSQKQSNPNVHMVVSMSLGGSCGGNCATDPINLAVEDLAAHKVVSAVAAGNDESDACSYSPASATSALTVGSSKDNDDRSGFSNFGSCIDIFAPGSDITSASISRNDRYETWSGTSMATPHVAGVVALWLAQTENSDPSPSANDVMAAVQCSALKGVVDDSRSALNLLLQVPPEDVSSLGDVDCGECEEVDGHVCSGHGTCLFGSCSCESGYSGESCETYREEWLDEDFCCSGGDLSSDTPPYNSIAVLWTDLNPESRGVILYGKLSDTKFAVVYKNVAAYGNRNCFSRIEVVLHADGQIDYNNLYSKIGNSCTSSFDDDITVGIKGPKPNDGEVLHETIFGPATSGLEYRFYKRFIPIANPPTSSPSTPDPTPAPTTSTPSLSPSTSVPTVSHAPTSAPTFSPTVSPTVVPTLSPTFSPTAAPTVQPSIDLRFDWDEFEARGGGNTHVFTQWGTNRMQGVQKCSVLSEEPNNKWLVLPTSGAIYTPTEDGILSGFASVLYQKVTLPMETTVVNINFGNDEHSFEWSQSLYENSYIFQLLTETDESFSTGGAREYFDIAWQLNLANLYDASFEKHSFAAGSGYWFEIQIKQGNTVHDCTRMEDLEIRPSATA